MPIRGASIIEYWGFVLGPVGPNVPYLFPLPKTTVLRSRVSHWLLTGGINMNASST